MIARRVLHCTRFFYLDTSNGAAIANRAMMECLARRGFGVEAVCGSIVESEGPNDPLAVVAKYDPSCAVVGAEETSSVWLVGGPGVCPSAPAHVRATVRGVGLKTLRRPLSRVTSPSSHEPAEFLSLFETTLKAFRPDVLVTYGGDPVTREMLGRARRAGIATVLTLHNFSYTDPSFFELLDAVIVPSHFSAEYYRERLGVGCTVISCLVDFDRVRVPDHKPGYVTFVNPSAEKGVFLFARVADELGRRRPDIPLLVVESRADEATLVGCGIDQRQHGNVFLMSPTPDPRDFWEVTRVCLMPSLWWESQGLVAVEAMVNGIPVVASDRGALPETLGAAGICVTPPSWMTPATRELPRPEEVQPWVDAIVRLWDDRAYYSERRERALAESGRWAPAILEPQYTRFFECVTLNPRSDPTETGRRKSERRDS